MLIAKFSNLRKFIDEAKDYLSATFVQGGYELLQNVCSLMTFGIYMTLYVILYISHAVCLADDKLGGIQAGLY